MKKNLMAVAVTGVLVALGAASCAGPAATPYGGAATGGTSVTSAPADTAPAAGSTAGTNTAPANTAPGSQPGASAAGTFTEYTPEAVSSASESEKVVLFFHATWCSTCKLLARDIEANAAQIPAGVKILKVDYDSETALKQKYGVTLQHTLVQVRPDGSPLAKWSLSRDLDAVIKELR